MGQGLGRGTAARDALTPLAPRIRGWQHPGAARGFVPLGNQPGWSRNVSRRVRGEERGHRTAGGRGRSGGSGEGGRGAELEPPRLS